MSLIRAFENQPAWRRWTLAVCLMALLAYALSLEEWRSRNSRGGSAKADGGAGSLAAAGAAPRTEKASGLFGLSVLHSIDINISEKEWEALEETYVTRPGNRGGGGNMGAGGIDAVESDYVRPDDGRMIHRGGGFGGFFPWVHAEMGSGDISLSNVGLRYKGNASYTASVNMMRRNLKIKTDLYSGTAEFHGSKTLNFNAGALDPSRVRESLSYAVFRAAGVPAPRTAFAEVTLTVPGIFKSEYLGLYTVVEQVNRQFAKDFLPDDKGLFLKPERANGGIAYLGENWSSYEGMYRPDREATPAEQKRVIDFARLISQATDSEFAEGIESYLDVDEFLRYVAVNDLLVNLDSFLTGRHNFIIYLNPSDQRFLFIPWDQDLSMGSFGAGRGGAGGPVAEYSLLRPAGGQIPLINRLLAMPEMNRRYVAIMRQIASTVFTKDKLLDAIDVIQGTTRDSLKREAAAMARRGDRTTGPAGGRGGGIGRGPPPAVFVNDRTLSVQKQLSETGATR